MPERRIAAGDSGASFQSSRRMVSAIANDSAAMSSMPSAYIRLSSSPIRVARSCVVQVTVTGALMSVSMSALLPQPLRVLGQPSLVVLALGGGEDVLGALLDVPGMVAADVEGVHEDQSAGAADQRPDVGGREDV